jgi:lactate permease
MPWYHNYSAVGNSLGLTALVVSIPILFLFWALAFKRMKGHIAGILTLLLTLIVTVLAYHMPVRAALSASVLGMVNGLFPIGWIILTAVFFYNLTVEAGQFEIIKSSISAISADRRLQALLIAFCFSAFMEGVSGQGAPVAVAAAMLIGMGFPPLSAAIVCLVANTPPVPFGPVGVPTQMMISVTKINDSVLTRAIGLDMCIIALIIPVFMLVVLAGWKKAMEVLPAALVAGVSYAITCYFVTRYVGVELPAILSSFVSIVCLVVFLKFWKPKSIWRFENDPEFPGEMETTYTAGRVTKTASSSAVLEISREIEGSYTAGQVTRAWSPYVVLMMIMGMWGIPAYKRLILDKLHWFVSIPSWPWLDGIVFRSAPIVAKPAKYAANYRWEFFSAAGTAMMISALVAMVILGIGPGRGVKVLRKTFKQLSFALVTLASVLGIAYLANYSGMSYTLGLAFAHYTGRAFPAFSPVIGWIGVFLTGSVTSSAALFGKLQQVTAVAINVNPVLTTSANLFGGVIGKLISPQSIAIACAATGLVGRETDIFRSTLRYSIILLLFVIAIVLLQAFVIPGIVPVDVASATQAI